MPLDLRRRRFHWEPRWAERPSEGTSFPHSSPTDLGPSAQVGARIGGVGACAIPPPGEVPAGHLMGGGTPMTGNTGPRRTFGEFERRKSQRAGTVTAWRARYTGPDLTSSPKCTGTSVPALTGHEFVGRRHVRGR